MAEFPKFLGIAMELFFAACDDEESDVRLKADECLNKIVRVTLILLGSFEIKKILK